MSNSVQNIQKNIKPGTCPHGLPAGACPVCSMGGGGSRKSDRNYTKPGEMTYHECVVMGMMLKERALAKKNHKLLLEHFSENARQFDKQMAKLSLKLTSFIQNMSKNFALKPVAFILQSTLLPVFNFVIKIPSTVFNIADKITQMVQKIIDVTTKLTTILGEIKNFIFKKFDNFIQGLKSKIKNLFKIFKKNDSEDEDTKTDDDKKIFNFKSILEKIRFKQKNKGE